MKCGNLATCIEWSIAGYGTIHPSLTPFKLGSSFLSLAKIYVVQRRGRLAPRQPLSVCALLPTPREEQASTASWEPRPPFEAAEMD